MMHNFTQYLNGDEKILYQGKSVPGKVKSNVTGLIIVIFFITIMQGVGIFGYRVGGEDTFIFITIYILVLLVIEILVIVNSIKGKKNVNACYCLTDKRVFKYDVDNDILYFGYLINYDKIAVVKGNDDYGSIIFEFIISENSAENNYVNVHELLINPDKTNMPSLTFESIEKVTEVGELARMAREELRKANYQKRM